VGSWTFVKLSRCTRPKEGGNDKMEKKTAVSKATGKEGEAEGPNFLKKAYT